MPLPYDKTSADSIASYAKLLHGKTLRQLLKSLPPEVANKNKGRFGQIIEEFYFRYKPNNNETPDFPEAGLELKTTPLKQSKNDDFSAKERLVLNVINYEKEYKNSWGDSSFWKKNARLLLIFYLHNTGLDVDKLIQISGLWDYPADDLKIIKQDWLKIVQKIKDGKAHEISEADTIYLAACVKGVGHGKDMKSQPFSLEKAKQRAFSLKQRYLNQIYRALKEPKAKYEADKVIKSPGDLPGKLTFEDLVIYKFQPYIGKKFSKICKKLNFSENEKDKGRFARVSRLIMGVKTKDVAEFVKAGITMKTIRISKSNMPDQDVSFPSFKYKQIVTETWDESELKTTLSSKFFFVIYRMKGNAEILEGVVFWQIPEKDLEVDVRDVWLETVSRIEKNRANDLPKKSETRVIHVRTHGRVAKDTDETPQGSFLPKKCFFFNADYIKEQIVDPMFE